MGQNKLFKQRLSATNSGRNIQNKNPQSLDLKTAGSCFEIMILLVPRILVTYGAVLEFLTAEYDLLVVLLTVSPVLLVVYAVATGTLQGLHG